MKTLYGSAERALEPIADVRARSGSVHGPDPAPYVRATTCDPHNRFAFDGLPDGGYFLIARVHLESVASEGESGLVLMQKVALTGGAMRQLQLPLRSRP